MFKFFSGHGKLPQEFGDAYICKVLSITFTELQKQPSWWVEQMIELYSAENEVQEFNLKKQKNRKSIR